MKTRKRLSLIVSSAATVAVFALAGCGDEGGGASADDPATLAPADTPLFVSGSIRPEGDLKTNLEDLAETVGGISDPGQRIIDELNNALAESDAKDITYEDDIEPWLGEKAAVFFQRFDGEEFEGIGAIIQTTDSDAAQTFIDDAAAAADDPLKEGSYEGVDYRFEDDGAVGIVEDFLVFGDTEQAFKDVVDASGGDALDGSDDYSSTTAEAPEGSLVDLYVNVGALIEQSGAAADPQVLQFYESLGYDFAESTALASVVPGENQVEVDVSADVGGAGIPSGDVSDFLGSFPAGAFAALGTPDVGEQLKNTINAIDETGFPPDLPPGQLKSTLARAGVDLEKIAGAIGDVGFFVQGTDLTSLGGAAVITTTDEAAARDAVQSIGRLLRRSDTPGITAVTGNAVGFAIRTPELGPKPLVVLAAGDRMAIGYGKEATEQAVSQGGETLAGSEAFEAASAALGGENLTGFVDFEPVLELADALGATADEDFELARPYLEKLDFITFGTGQQGDLATQKVIVTFKEE